MNWALLLGLFGRRPEQVTVTFNANTTWAAPPGVNLLPSVTGHGQNGTADTTFSNTTYTLRTDTYVVYDDGASVELVSSSTSSATESSAVPGFYCTPRSSYTLNGHYNRSFCYEYHKESSTSSGGSPGSTGANATGFGLTFAGGTPATPTAATTTNSNVAIAGGASYTIIVPSGATIQITYFV